MNLPMERSTAPTLRPAPSLAARPRAEAPRRSGVDLLADWLTAYGEYRTVAPMPDHEYRSILRAPSPVPGRPVFADLMRATGQSAAGGPPAEVV
jgi:hypothetical protein